MLSDNNQEMFPVIKDYHLNERHYGADRKSIAAANYFIR